MRQYRQRRNLSRFRRLSGHTTCVVIAAMSYGSRVVYVHLDELAYFILSIELVTRGGGGYCQMWAI